jgi:hypothetical protein
MRIGPAFTYNQFCDRISVLMTAIHGDGLSDGQQAAAAGWLGAETWPLVCSVERQEGQ